MLERERIKEKKKKKSLLQQNVVKKKWEPKKNMVDIKWNDRKKSKYRVTIININVFDSPFTRQTLRFISLCFDYLVFHLKVWHWKDEYCQFIQIKLKKKIWMKRKAEIT